MPHTFSIMSLHLRYRLWIAEMNSDIDMIRICDDDIKAIISKKNETDVRTKIDYFVKQFILVRKDIDNLRHEMHLIKMKLAAYSRENMKVDYKTYKSDNHTLLMKRYFTFKKIFNKTKAEFKRFEGEYLD